MPSQFPNPLILSSLDGINGFELDGVAASDSSGISVSTAGDVNGDGIADILIGAGDATVNGNAQAGKTYVVFGKSSWATPISLSTLDGTNGFELDGLGLNDASGTSVSTAGDINGDGFADILIGAPAAGGNNGKTYVVFGKKTGWTSPISLNTLMDGMNGFELDGGTLDRSANSVSTAGDINGDGFSDILIKVPNNGGKTYVVFGKSTGWMASASLSTLMNGMNGFELDSVGSDNNVRGATSVSTAGDINGDGIADILIGAPGSANSPIAGKTYVVFGKKTGWTASASISTLMDGTQGFELDGVGSSDRSGASVSTAGDVNGDGFADILIGAPGRVSMGLIAGKTYVVFGKKTGWMASASLSTLMDGTQGFELDGVGSSDRSGASVRTAGDINGDGFADILIGAPNANLAAGKTYAVFGKRTGWMSSTSLNALMDGTQGFELDGVTSNDQSGFSVSTAGDVNGDKIADILIGAPGNGAGKTYVVFGNSLSTIAPTLQPTVLPTVAPSLQPTVVPTLQPTSVPTVKPTLAPTTLIPTLSPTLAPTFAPTSALTLQPTLAPTVVPTTAPTSKPTVAPTSSPTVAPTLKPTAVPTLMPTVAPTLTPTVAPTFAPTSALTLQPTVAPTLVPTTAPTSKPTVAPTSSPTVAPTLKPTAVPTLMPTVAPTFQPTVAPTLTPTVAPTTLVPTLKPTSAPTSKPTRPTKPTRAPVLKPTHAPTKPTSAHTSKPTHVHTLKPTRTPTLHPTHKPTHLPTPRPTHVPSNPTSKPAHSPTYDYCLLLLLLEKRQKSISNGNSTGRRLLTSEAECLLLLEIERQRGRRLLASTEDLPLDDNTQTSSATQANAPLFDWFKRPVTQLSDYAANCVESTLVFFGKKLEKTLLNSPSYFPNIESKAVNDWQPGGSVLHQFKTHTPGTLLSISGTQQNSLNASLKIGF